MQVVYADVLIILNTYVNFALLRLTSLISSTGASRWRLFLSSLFGGVYSLIILVDGISSFVSFILKVSVCALMTLIAFGYGDIRRYIKKTLAFLFVNFLFAGAMFALWIFVRPDTMLFNNATVYFQFDTLTLLTATSVCYAVLRFIYFIIEKRAPKGHLYTLTVEIANKKVTCDALLDSGSSLKDYFTSFPIIAVDRSVFDFIPMKIEDIPANLKPRYVPINTVSGDSLMLTVQPDKVRILGVGEDFETEEVRIGLSDTKIKNGDFQAVLPYTIFETRGEKTYV